MSQAPVSAPSSEVAGVSGSEAPAGDQGFPRKTADGVLLAEVRADSAVLELAISNCVAQTCPVQVILRSNGNRLDAVATEWPSSGNEPYADTVEPGWGAGDPLQPAAVEAWATGEEEQYLGISARAVRLAPGLTGMLVDQRTGFEHLRRRHDLFVAREQKLERLWAGSEGAGPAWTSVDLVKLSDSREGLVYFDGFRYPTPDEPDQLQVSLLEWVPGSKVIKKSDYAAQIATLTLDGFPSVASAHALRAKEAACLGLFWVLPASQLQGATAKFALVLPSLSESALATKRAEVVGCAPGRIVKDLRLIANE
ncbi:MAG: hypothetical protein U5J83_07615 [Bryobacterales bacterium]|nr:hypothetical protein [Bryobacterales bacterium]